MPKKSKAEGADEEPRQNKKKPAITRHLKELEDGGKKTSFYSESVVRKRQSSESAQQSPKVRISGLKKATMATRNELSHDLEGMTMDQLDRMLRHLGEPHLAIVDNISIRG